LRAHLTDALQATDRELDTVRSQHERLAHELGDPSEIRSERDAVQRAITQLTLEHTEILNELAKREVHSPDTWANRALGEPPADPRLRKEWEQGVRQLARYRLQYGVTDPDNPLGADPRTPKQQRDWQRARESLDRTARRLGRDRHDDHDLAINIGHWSTGGRI
jgi:hypothetical protein